MSWPSEKIAHRLRDAQESDYNSKDGIQSAIFGPAFWMCIHLTSFNYPVEPSESDKLNYHNWLMAIGNVLPCKYCRENFAKNLQNAKYSESSLKSRATFSRFCYDLHCVVNTMLDKPPSPCFEEVRRKYEMFRAKCLTEEQKSTLMSENKELGCIRPVHNGARGKCIINIVPTNEHAQSENIIVDDRCKPSS